MAEAFDGGALLLLLQEMLRDIRSLQREQLRLEHRTLKTLERLEAGQHTIMSTFQEVVAIIRQIDVAGNQISAAVAQVQSNLTGISERINRILEQLASGVTAGEVAEIKSLLTQEASDVEAQAAALQPVVDRSAELGRDPENPIPPEMTKRR